MPSRQCPYPKSRGKCPYPKSRVSLSQEQRKVSLSQGQRRFLNHWREKSGLPCTTHEEGGLQVHLSYGPSLDSYGKLGARSTTRQGSKRTKNLTTPWSDHIPNQIP